MSALTEFKIKSLQDFRAGILDLKKEDLTPQVLMSYFETNVAKVTRAPRLARRPRASVKRHSLW
jgi:hypothetical protein